MKNILLYGDSFFWGVDAGKQGRHEHQNQIGVICQTELGNDYTVVTEGLRGRTMFGDNGWFPERDGLVQFGPIFASHLPLDAVVLLLGTNDLNSKTNHQPDEIATAIDTYKQKMQFWCDFMKYPVPNLMIIAPPNIDESSLAAFKDIFVGSATQVPKLRDVLRDYAKRSQARFLDAAEIVISKQTDGIHLDDAENHKLASAIAAGVKELV